MRLRNQPLLNVILDDSVLQSVNDFTAMAKKVLQGGANLIQLRVKKYDEAFFFRVASAVKKICTLYDIPLIINNDVDVVLLSDADGVHLGQSDLAVAKARKILPPHKIIGSSVFSLEQAQNSYIEGADYLGVGALFPTSSKNDAVQVPLEIFETICRGSNLPTLGIGGVTLDNVKDVMWQGAAGVAVINAVLGMADPKQACHEFLKKMI